HSSSRPRRSDSSLPPLLRVLAGADAAVLLLPHRRGCPPCSLLLRPAAGAAAAVLLARSSSAPLPALRRVLAGADFGPFSGAGTDLDLGP
ncbi:Os06g0288400, partial [Oryza sativa Japonica Group]